MPKKFITEIVASFIAFIAPWAIVLFFSATFFSNRVLPEMAEVHRQSSESMNIMNDTSNNLLNMSIGLFIASFWVFRQEIKSSAKSFHTFYFILSIFLCIISIYSGIRFKFDLAFQVQYTFFDFEPLSNRIFWQGGALIGQVSVLSTGSLLLYLRNDRRFLAR